MVEGDAENILIPIIADILGYPLEKYGISIVNVGSTAFLRYSGIMVRKDEQTIGIPVSVITDCDVKPCYKEKTSEFDAKEDESIKAVEEKEKKYSIGTVKGFVSPRWTLEYCLAMSCLGMRFHKAIHYGKKIKNSDRYSLTAEKIVKANQNVSDECEQWKTLSEKERAYKIYHLMLDENDKSGLKAIVAQSLSSILKWDISVIPDDVKEEQMFDLDLYSMKRDEEKQLELKTKIESDKFLSYIVNAIKYAAGETV